ncbi:MAG: hypothetical protein ABL955_03825 [Elusimicrobiota bacterium]
MTRKENLLGMGMVIINAAFVLQLSWIPVIFFLEGANWVTAGMAVGIHRFALVYIVIAPLAYGIRRWFDGDRAEVLTPWLLRCQLPLTIIAALIYGFERVIPTRLPVIGGMMMAIIVFGLYGVALRREGVLAD